MTDEMLALARAKHGEGRRDECRVPKRGRSRTSHYPENSVDVVISNCVINLSTDKRAVFSEIARVLKPGGRLGVSDIVADDRLSTPERAERGSYAGCIAGALSKTEYLIGLRAAGFDDVTVRFTHELLDGIHGAIVKATKPVDRTG